MHGATLVIHDVRIGSTTLGKLRMVQRVYQGDIHDVSKFVET